MNSTVARVLLWILAVLSLMLLVYTGHKSFEKEGILNLEFLAFIFSTTVFVETIRADERLNNDG